MDINIRKATATDALAIAALVKELDIFGNLASEPVESLAERIRRTIEENERCGCHSIFIALSTEGFCAGYANVHWLPYLILKNTEGFVSELFIKENIRNQGIGSELIAAIRSEAENRGCERLNLLNIRTRESYKRGFYKAHGWKEREDVANFIYNFNKQE